MGCTHSDTEEPSPATSTDTPPHLASCSVVRAVPIVSERRTAQASPQTLNTAAVNPFTDFEPGPLPREYSQRSSHAVRQTVSATRRTRARVHPQAHPQTAPQTQPRKSSDGNTAELESARLVRWDGAKDAAAGVRYVDYSTVLTSADASIANTIDNSPLVREGENPVVAEDGATSAALIELQPQPVTGSPSATRRRTAPRRSPSHVHANIAPFS
jgi:antitoxin (DNA-binding transcriptional repressor) of toxin-antitoxin stability system